MMQGVKQQRKTPNLDTMEDSMNFTQNDKLNQVTEDTLVVGIDIAKYKHVARAIDHRGRVLTKPFSFPNTQGGFQSFFQWTEELQHTYEKRALLCGMEPTGHYWLNLAYELQERDIPFGVVNPFHVKRSKELDDNSPTKNDAKDARVIAKLLQEGRFSYPRLPQGEEAEVKVGVKLRDQLIEDLRQVQGRVHNWLDRYFPEFLTAFKDWKGKLAKIALKHYVFPSVLAQSQPEDVMGVWRKHQVRPNRKKAQALVVSAKRSVGLTVGKTMAQKELLSLLERYEDVCAQIEALDEELEGYVSSLPGVAEMATIPGVTVHTVVELYAEIGDIRNFTHPRQLLKYAGLNLRENTSGTMRGQTTITKRGRRKLRALLFRMTIPMVKHNAGFRALHHYYIARTNNPLKKKQSLIALCGKLVRILFAVAVQRQVFDVERMIRDIPALAA